MSESITSGGKKLRIEKPGSAPQVVMWKHLLPLWRSIFRQAGWNLQIDGAESSRAGLEGEVQFKIKPSTGAAQGLDVGSDGKVIAATVMSVMPTIGGTRLDDGTPPLLSIASTGTKYIVINVTGTFDLKDSTFVLGFTGAPTVTITVESDDPGFGGTHAVSTGEFKFLLATFVDGVRTSQNGHGPVTAEICDTLKENATANLNLTWASA